MPFLLKIAHLPIYADLIKVYIIQFGICTINMSPGVHDKMIITNIIVDFAHISCMDTKNMECDHFFENGWLVLNQ